MEIRSIMCHACVALYDASVILINGFAVQCKASSDLAGLQYSFGLHVSGGRKNGKSTSMPYPSDNGIVFFIFEIIDHPDQFYIVPKEVLEEKGYFKTETDEGKTKIYVPPPSYKGRGKNKWLTDYINRVDLFIMKSEPSQVQKYRATIVICEDDQ